MFSSIRIRLTLSHLLVIVLAMGLSGFLLLSFLERYFLQAMEDSLIAQARITAQTLIPEATIGGPSIEEQAPAYNAVQQQRLGNLSLQTQNVAPPTADLPLDLNNLTGASLELSTLLDTHIRLLDAHGVVVVDSWGVSQGQDLQTDPLVAQALTGQYARRTDSSILDFWWGQTESRTDNDSRTSSRSRDKVINLRQEAAMHLAMPVMVEGKLVGVVYLSQPLSDVTAVLHDLRLIWLSSTIIALILSGLVSLLLSRAIANPLRRLTEAASAVARGQLDQQVPVKSRDELGRLSQTFNEMTNRLKAARQMQLDMVANVSHELRTPLTSINGLIETLRDGAVDDPEVRDSFLETAENETNRLIRLVRDLLLLSRVDSETLNLQKRPTDLVQLVQDTVDRLSFQAETNKLVLNVEANSTCSTVEVDPDRIEQVLVNLLDNAIKYSQPGGCVTISLDGGPDQSVLIQIKDEGIGISAEELPRIGERFYRADKARSRARGGSGLGLAIARSLVEAHGGALWMESQEGEGTVVSFTLPCPLI
jgi:two-component system sensor histidine kinase BaeS